ncbi:unnamed protein product [Moneuplotes crassus]|uniref:Leucine-rich repeat protein n=1 Tax=Euplotes crassus TaxID=5936 RepID=A0AAD1XPZ9_EUPCR|nr:unnamed protein product [Moneuplotes crassus]
MNRHRTKKPKPKSLFKHFKKLNNRIIILTDVLEKEVDSSKASQKGKININRHSRIKSIDSYIDQANQRKLSLTHESKKKTRQKLRKLRNRKVSNCLEEQKLIEDMKLIKLPEKNAKPKLHIWPSFNTDEELLSENTNEFLRFDFKKKPIIQNKVLVRENFMQRNVRNIKRPITSKSRNGKPLHSRFVSGSSIDHQKHQKKFTGGANIKTCFSPNGRNNPKKRLLSAENSEGRNNYHNETMFSVNISTGDKNSLFSPQNYMSQASSDGNTKESPKRYFVRKRMKKVLLLSKQFSEDKLSVPDMMKSQNSIIIDKTPNDIDYVFTNQQIKQLISVRSEDFGCNYSDFQKELMQKIVHKNCRNSIIRLNNLKFGLKSLEYLSDLMYFSKRISRLYLSNNSIGDQGVEKISKFLKGYNDLVHLDISSNKITPGGFIKLFDALLKNITLVSLDLSNRNNVNKNRLGEEGAKALGNLLESNKMIQILDLSMLSIQDYHMKELSNSIVASDNLVSLRLSNNELSFKSMSSICHLFSCNYLQKLDISYNTVFTDNSMAIFCKHLKHQKKNLKVLKIKNCGKITPFFFKILSQNRYLTQISLSHNDLHTIPLQTLKPFLISTNLTHISISHCRLDDAHKLCILKYLPKNPLIKRVDLEGNNFSFTEKSLLAKYTPKESRNYRIDEEIIPSLLKVHRLKNSKIQVPTINLGDAGAIEELGEVKKEKTQEKLMDRIRLRVRKMYGPEEKAIQGRTEDYDEVEMMFKTVICEHQAEHREQVEYSKRNEKLFEDITRDIERLKKQYGYIDGKWTMPKRQEEIKKLEEEQENMKNRLREAKEQ